MTSKNLFSGRSGILVLALFIAGCATFQKDFSDFDRSFYAGEFEKAASSIELKSKEDSKDQLLYLLNRATALQLAKKYEESSKDYILADRLSDVKDYTSLSGEAASLIVNDSIKQYPGEDFEKVVINAFNAINFAVVGDLERARVETRRVNQKLYRYKYEAKRDYEQNPFAFYLAGVMWEASGNLDSAFIDYKSAAELVPHFPLVRRDVARLAKKLKRTDELKKWTKKLELNDDELQEVKVPKDSGELVLIFQQGRCAVKRPHPAHQSFPKFYHRGTITQRARLEINEHELVNTEPIYNVSEIAIKTLDDAYGKLIAKRVAGTVGKYVLADQVRQKNEALGTLTWIALNVIDKADTRHWSTLPETLQFARVYLPAGKQTVKITGLDASNQPSGEETTMEVDIVKGKKTFITWRSLK